MICLQMLMMQANLSIFYNKQAKMRFILFDLLIFVGFCLRISYLFHL